MKRKPQQRQREQAVLTPESQIEVFAATLAAASAEGGQRLANCVFYSGSTVLRMDFWTGEKYNLTLSMKPEHVRLGRLNNGAPVLDSHSSWGIGSVLGVVEGAALEGGKGVASLRFSDRADVESVWKDVQAGILRNVSMGSQIHKLKDVTKEDEKMKSYLAVDWEPVEISLVGVPADPGAGFLSAQLGLDDFDVEELASEKDLVVIGAASQQQTLLSLLLRQRQQWQ